jgi:hypothetical protein
VKVSTAVIESSNLRVTHAYTWPGAHWLTYLCIAKCFSSIIPFPLRHSDRCKYCINTSSHISVAGDICVCCFSHMSSVSCYTGTLKL